MYVFLDFVMEIMKFVSLPLLFVFVVFSQVDFVTAKDKRKNVCYLETSRQHGKPQTVVVQESTEVKLRCALCSEKNDDQKVEWRKIIEDRNYTRLSLTSYDVEDSGELLINPKYGETSGLYICQRLGHDELLFDVHVVPNLQPSEHAVKSIAACKEKYYNASIVKYVQDEVVAEVDVHITTPSECTGCGDDAGNGIQIEWAHCILHFQSQAQLDLPCKSKSAKLRMQSVSDEVRSKVGSIPSCSLNRTCKCDPSQQSRLSTKYNYYFVKGGHNLEIKCPITLSPYSAVEWKINDRRVPAGEYFYVDDCSFWCSCPSVFVSPYLNSLTLYDAKKNQQGSYECRADDRSWKVMVVVYEDTDTCRLSPYGIATIVCLFLIPLLVACIILCIRKGLFSSCQAGQRFWLPRPPVIGSILNPPSVPFPQSPQNQQQPGVIHSVSYVSSNVPGALQTMLSPPQANIRMPAHYQQLNAFGGPHHLVSNGPPPQPSDTNEQHEIDEQQKHVIHGQPVVVKYEQQPVNVSRQEPEEDVGQPQSAALVTNLIAFGPQSDDHEQQLMNHGFIPENYEIQPARPGQPPPGDKNVHINLINPDGRDGRHMLVDHAGIQQLVDNGPGHQPGNDKRRDELSYFGQQPAELVRNLINTTQQHQLGGNDEEYPTYVGPKTVEHNLITQHGQDFADRVQQPAEQEVIRLANQQAPVKHARTVFNRGQPPDNDDGQPSSDDGSGRKQEHDPRAIRHLGQSLISHEKQDINAEASPASYRPRHGLSSEGPHQSVRQHEKPTSYAKRPPTRHARQQ